jgi:hypothetical protein
MKCGICSAAAASTTRPKVVVTELQEVQEAAKSVEIQFQGQVFSFLILRSAVHEDSHWSNKLYSRTQGQ